MKIPANGLSVLLHAALGPAWQRLHPDIRDRFTLAPGATRQRYSGIMQRIECSALGCLIARLIAFMRVLPAVRASGVPFDFNLTATTGGGWIKERLYHFKHGRFEFRSVMRLEPTGELIENFPYGLCMKIRLATGGDTLYFLDDGYFLRRGTLRLPIPRWLSVGRFTLAHINLDHDNFRVDISLDHPWFGRLFHQSGEFRQAPVAAISGGAATPAPAHTAACATARCQV
jgi:Domain of unknown function (DUF4166)